ncbi:MAG: insulinase family protein [Candidatus Sungbacteria bacterium]|nr:insulinase family protein [Candidatus Sungbacteria bacterium]
MFRKTTLKNGLRIITAPMTGTNTVTVLVLCETGSDNEPEGKIGISHFLEHLFFKGTKRRPTPQIVNQELDSMGGFSNAYTWRETTGYYIKVGKIYFEAALDILADIYTSALLKDEEIERERQVIIEERKMRLDDPSIHYFTVWEELLYGSQHAGQNVIGAEETIRSLAPEDFRKYFESQYTSKNTIVTVAGSFEESHAIGEITKHFGAIREGEPRPRALFHEEQKSPGIKLFFKETDQSHLALGFRGLDIFDQDRYATDMLAVVLGGGWSSRMYETVREKLGLAYEVHTDTHSYTNRGHFYTYAGVSHTNVEKTIEAVLGEYHRLFESPVTPDELRRAKDLVKGRMLIRLEASNAVAGFVGEEEALTKQPLTVDEVFAKIEAVSLEDIERVARRIFMSDRLNLAMIGPFKDEAKLEGLLTL